MVLFLLNPKESPLYPNPPQMIGDISFLDQRLCTELLVDFLPLQSLDEME